jgi:predicted enzyme related to lactoylglutathione lyase
MPKVDSHAPGNFCWVELGTTDQAEARKFYQSLFGWEATEQPMGPGETYTLFRKTGSDAAAGYRLRPDQKGVPPNWQVYVRVASADDAAARARDLGATVLAAPFDVFDAGRMAVFQDPPAPSSRCGRRDGNKARRRGRAGAFCWAELLARPPPVGGLLQSLFGWGRGRPATEWTLGDRSIGGMIEMQKEWGEMPPHWLVYFQVEDCDRSVEKAKGMGAKVTMGPQDFPGVGRIALLNDPQGAAFYVIRLTGVGH